MHRPFPSTPQPKVLEVTPEKVLTRNTHHDKTQTQVTLSKPGLWSLLPGPLDCSSHQPKGDERHTAHVPEGLLSQTRDTEAPTCLGSHPSLETSCAKFLVRARDKTAMERQEPAIFQHLLVTSKALSVTLPLRSLTASGSADLNLVWSQLAPNMGLCSAVVG